MIAGARQTTNAYLAKNKKENLDHLNLDELLLHERLLNVALVQDTNDILRMASQLVKNVVTRKPKPY